VRVRVLAIVLAATAALGAGAAAAAASPYGKYRLVDRIEHPARFTLRMLRPGPTCRKVVHTRQRCFTLRQGPATEYIGEGLLSVSGHQLSFRDDVRGSCPGAVGRYTYKQATGGLAVRLVSDSCPGRRHLFLAGLWRRA
jgi:hypothetical protein